MKKTIVFVLSFLLTLMSIGLCGCADNNKRENTNETLDIYCLDAGYGTAWLDDIIELFRQQDWVKEKYPNLNVLPPVKNDLGNFAQTKFSSGSNSNKFDLFFTTNMDSYMGPGGELADLIEGVYESMVPGEDIIWKDKADESFNAFNKYIDVADMSSEHYYTISWAAGMDSIIYNENILSSFGLDVPNTTDEFEHAMEVIMANKGQNNGKYNKGYSLVSCSKTHYFESLFPIWWAQYEGLDRYYDFYKGIDDGRYSRDIFNQEGRQKSLEVYEQLLDFGKGYLAPMSFTMEFIPLQTSFLQGNSVFYPCGDWFDNEMRKIEKEIIEQEGGIDTFKMMPCPVISALGEKLGITDQQLSALIDFVDGKIEKPEFTSTKNYSEGDVINQVREARSIVESIGNDHMAVIPEYAQGKQVAMDFLRFMGTDIAIEAYFKATHGARLPFRYNVKEKQPELYNTFSTLQKSCIECFNFRDYDINTLPNTRSFPLVRYGGVTAFSINEQYFINFSSEKPPKTAEDYMKLTKDYWTEDRWNKALSNAGIK